MTASQTPCKDVRAGLRPLQGCLVQGVAFIVRRQVHQHPTDADCVLHGFIKSMVIARQHDTSVLTGRICRPAWRPPVIGRENSTKFELPPMNVRRPLHKVRG